MDSNIKFNYGNVFLSVDPGDGSLVVQFKGDRKEVIPYNLAIDLIGHIKEKQGDFEDSQHRSFFEVITGKFKH